MIELLTFIVDFVNTILQLVVMLLSSIVNLITMIPTFMNYTFQLFAWLPQPYAMFAIFGLTLSVLLYIVGRQT